MTIVIKKEILLKIYKKIAMCTDIHFGAQQNSVQHNLDCIAFIHFFIEQIKKNKCDCIIFLGDWWENRNALNVQTINYSLQGIRLLNALGLPVYFIIGNHDLYFRNNRNMHSGEIFREFKNIHIVDQPLSLADHRTKEKKFLILPYLFKDEYVPLVEEINAHKYVFGHFEFRNFYLTGSSNQVCEHGFIHKLLNGPKYIFSGHFHKRQASENVVYIGNTFPTNYGDANDNERGMAILDIESDEVDFINFNGPTFIKTTLSKLAGDEVDIKKYARIRCLLDIPDLTYSEAQQIKNEFMEIYELRDFVLEEKNKDLLENVSNEALKELDEMDLSSIDESIKRLILEGIEKVDKIDPVKLIQIYGAL